MKTLFLTSAILLFYTLGFSQNLILNGDFEQYTNCPSSGDFDSLLFWKNPCPTHGYPTGGSPDFFDSCSASSLWSVPVNFGGYQVAHSGKGYGGLATYHQAYPNFREYIEGTFLYPLKSQSCYYIQMYVCLPNEVKYTGNSIGVYFTDTIVSGITNSLPLPFSPQLQVGNNFITDTANWTLISDYYTAVGNEKYLLVGNFNYDSATSILTVNSSALYPVIYFYIDDISLTEVPCGLGVIESDVNPPVAIYPNPVNNWLTIISHTDEPLEVIIYDLSQREVLKQMFKYSTTLNTEQMEKGIYIYELRNTNGIFKKGKVIKQ